MVNIKTLLPDLKKVVGELAEDLLARATENTEIDTGLRQAFKQIEKGGRTAQAYEVWREDYLDQVAVAWVLACVFVRFMEDNHLIDECWLTGEKERRKLAEDSHELFFRKHPHDTDREYFQHVFHEVGKIAAAKDLFAEGKTPLWAVAPSGDAAMKLRDFWREMDAKTGNLLRSFEVKDGDTRFLGDLYQDLSERARKKYALLQTPVFVEEFILDRTLNPAIDEFGLDKVRMIDPTCGSGHFLLGGFARLFDQWIKRENNEIVAAQKALDGVWGVDINPFAVAIARFRLIVAALQACGIKRLKEAPAWKIHLATGDSLLFGNRWTRSGEKELEQIWLASDEESWAPEIYACEDKEAIQEVLCQQYHAVVGNPPYIVVRDRVLNAAYRGRYSACAGKYSLAVPFAERMFDLCLTNGNGKSGYVGMITANSFMKREFGKKLIEEFFPKIDLTHVLDTSGAYIPGHTTPTVILLGRSRQPVGETVRAVLGIKGEPSTPDNPSQGFVWRSIIRHIDIADAQDEYTSTADVRRSTFATHPWSIGGGAAADVKELVEEASQTRLGDTASSIGVMAVTLEDDAFAADSQTHLRNRIDLKHQIDFVEGDVIRDWMLSGVSTALFPYSLEDLKPELPVHVNLRLWPFRAGLRRRLMFGKTQLERGLNWYEYGMLIGAKLRSPLSIAFAFVASHNHFVFDRGGRVFNRSAPVIKLGADASEDDCLGLLGLLNSSTACFWMKQVFYPKSTAAKDIDADRGKPEANRYEFTATGLLSYPVPSQESPVWFRIITIARNIDKLASRSVAILPGTILAHWDFHCTQMSLGETFASAESKHGNMKLRMIALQEELDWEVYKAYGLVDQGGHDVILADEDQGIHAEWRPFLWTGDSAPDGLPDSWRAIYEQRRRLLNDNTNLKLLETPVFKRPWWGRQGVYGQASRTYKEWVVEACHDWLLGRLEENRYWPKVELQSTAQLADQASGDHDFMQVAALYRGRPDFDVAALLAELVSGLSVPFFPILRYKPAGLRKRSLWEQTWELQRQQDAGKDVGDIPVPPKYTSADFQNADNWRLRGKLDVPKERWISYPHCETDSDPTLVVGWAGWNHLQQATALIAYYDARKREGWNAKRLTPLLAGLDQLLPWIHQWHPEIDPEFGETAGQSFQTMLEHDAHELGLTIEDIRNWQPESKPRKTRNTRTKIKAAEGDE